MKQVCLFSTLFLLFFCFLANGQDLQETKKLYLEGKFAEAKPGAEKLVKATPGNASYNQWYGACLFETGEYDASKKYLELAASKGIQESFRYLGQLYYMQYDFDKSMESYEKYIELLKKKKDTKDAEGIEPLLDQSKKAARMLKHVDDIQIIDSVVVDKNRFLEYYHLSDEYGSFVAQDNDMYAIYTNQLANKRYYSKLAADSTFKLYSQVKLLEKWSDEALLSNEINSPSDNNFPFVMSDGVTVYFASKGHGSIGGYDLFVTRYNNTNDSYLAPEQLGMPYNSIGNDYMLAIDDLNGVGYFTTDRFQPKGKVIIYTFIPNPERTTVSSEDEEVLRGRAKIASIKSSWKGGNNYSELLQKIHTDATSSGVEEKKDFDFIINDNIIYHSLSDFESDAAKSTYLESQKLKGEINTLEETLENNRIKYGKASADAKKSITNTILEAENKLGGMQDKYEELMMSARNTEIKQLRQQKK